MFYLKLLHTLSFLNDEESGIGYFTEGSFLRPKLKARQEGNKTHNECYPNNNRTKSDSVEKS